jgi:short-subunit dehydrogenase
LQQDREEIHRVMQINYGGLVNVSLAALPRLLAQGHGSLINFCSIAGWVPNMHFGAYCASKFAAVAFTEVLYHENRGKGVHIACVCPSQVDTGSHLISRTHPKRLDSTVRGKLIEPNMVYEVLEGQGSNVYPHRVTMSAKCRPTAWARSSV